MNPIKHVAIIMDGNGRWGIKNKKSRNMGHKAGLASVEKIIKKTQIINNPTAVRNMPEKLCSVDFLKLMPPTIFTRDFNEIKKFKKKISMELVGRGSVINGAYPV